MNLKIYLYIIKMRTSKHLFAKRKGHTIMSEEKKYNLEYIREIAEECMYSDEEYHTKLIAIKKERSRETIMGFYCADARHSAVYEIFKKACYALDIDDKSIISIEKSIRRQEKKLNWQKCVHVGWSNEESYKKNIAIKDPVIARIARWYC